MLKSLFNSKKITAPVFAGFLLLSAAMGGDEKSLIIDDKCCVTDPSGCELFDKSTLYENENASLIQKVQLLATYHGQYQSSSLEHSSGRTFGSRNWEHRFVRLGGRVQFLNDFAFHLNWDIGDNNVQNERFAGGDFWGTLQETYIKWTPSESENDFYLLVGKRRQVITREYDAGIYQVLTGDRSMVTGEVATTTAWGAETGFKTGKIEHNFGLWLGGFDMNDFDARGERFPGFDSRGGASYRGVFPLNEVTDFHFDYLYSNNSNGRVSPQGRDDANALSNYNHVFALGTESEWGIGATDRKIGLVTDLIFGIDRQASVGNALGIAGGNNSIAAGDDTFGIVILPTYDLTNRLQLVGRYTYLSQSRIQQPQSTVFGQNNLGLMNLDDIHTFYLGFNYRLCGDNLKLVAGFEHMTSSLHQNIGSSDLGKLKGNTLVLGVRTHF